MITELIKNIDKVLQVAAREEAREIAEDIAEDINIAFDERMDQLIKAGTFVFKDKLYQIQEYHPLMATAVKIGENKE